MAEPKPPRVARFRVAESKAGRRDLAILGALRAVPGFESVSRSQLKKWMESAALREEAGWITLTIPELRALDLDPIAADLDLLFEDAHLLVVNKPSGMSVHPSETETGATLVQALLHHVKDLSGIGGVERPGIVHRLDKNTSGSIVVAKTDAAHLSLAKQFAEHTIERRYWALCYGTLPSPAMKIESRIGRNPSDRKKMAFNVKDGREARTAARVLARYAAPGARAPFGSWIEARLHTGRTHQVRVHLTHHGASLLGDPVYGKPAPSAEKWKKIPANVRPLVAALPGQALHARVLGFTHPATGEWMRFEAEAPPAFRALHEALAPFAEAP